mgnify:CR=1 FL=1
MADCIKLLPEIVANQIKAGEVVESPSSVVKEMMENAIDAGATEVTVNYVNGGRDLVQIIDNGRGMSPVDARMAFECHATSKILSLEDIYSLHTFGFRGEALASIAAISQVELRTRQHDAETGTETVVNGGVFQSQKPIMTEPGSQFLVRNLFYNVPARRKFLKTDQTEMRNIITEYQRIVLVNPQVQFTLVNNDEIISELPTSSTKQRIEAIFGHTSKPFTAQLVDIQANTELVNIYGFVGKPEMATKNSQQFFFVNSRYMRHPYFHKAITTAYSGLLAPDHNPSYFIYFDIQPDAIDVNIHPTKTEIKFVDEQAIFQILLATVREALGKFNIAPSLDFTLETQIDMPAMPQQPTTIAMPRLQVDPNYNPFKQTSYPRNVSAGWEQLYPAAPVEQHAIQVEQPLFVLPEVNEQTPLIQWQNKYILLPAESGLMMVHQHRVHVAILYQELLRQFDMQQGASQSLLFPEVLELSYEDVLTLQSLMDDLQAIGFAMDQLSPTAFTITAVPSQLGAVNPCETLLQVVHQVQDTGSNAAQQWRETMAIALADRMAIPMGKSLSDAEMRDLLMRFYENQASQYLTNGQTIFTIITPDEVQKRF